MSEKKPPRRAAKTPAPGRPGGANKRATPAQADATPAGREEASGGVEVLEPPGEPAPPPPGPTAREAAAAREELERAWEDEPGLWGWLTTVNHKRVALRTIVTSFVFFLIAGVLAAMMRAQLSRPSGQLLGPDAYNQVFTTHGTAMMFLFGVPMVEAVGLYLVPLMVGTRNLAYPRLNAYGYWTYLIGGLLLFVALFLNSGPDVGWFAYVPLSGPEYSPGKRVDVWAQMITFTEIAGIISAIEIIATVFKQRAPGMSLNRIPLFVWAMVVMSVMVMFALPTVAAGSTLMLAMDRLVSTHFFNPAEGGDALLWQHLFWFFGHPEVYIIFIPALGMVSSIVATHARRPVFGYTAIVLSMVATGFLGFGLWVHHMFATTIPHLGQSFFTAASALIALPSGVQLFCWLATLWAGRPRLTTALLWVLGFVFVFTVGGVTGVMLASIPVDLQLTDTYFVPAHIHYVLIGGFVFPLFGAFYHWFPKVTGRMLGERAGKAHFWLFFLGTNVTFFPMFILALMGMPRRVYTYLPETGWGPLNMVASLGSVFLAAGVIVFIGNVAWALRRGRVAGADPWGGDTLEWATSSPPPRYNFEHVPVVRGRSALWAAGAELPVVTGLQTDRRQVLLTTALDAEPDARHSQPSSTIMPFFLALATGVTFIMGMFTPWGYVVGPALAIFPMLGWTWPRGRPPGAHDVIEVPR